MLLIFPHLLPLFQLDLKFLEGKDQGHQVHTSGTSEGRLKIVPKQTRSPKPGCVPRIYHKNPHLCVDELGEHILITL